MEGSTFTFTMDSFPAYPKFNKTKKAFCVMQLIGDDSLVPSTAEEEEGATCKPMAVALDEVKAGAADWTVKEFPNDPKKVKFTTLGSNLSATMSRANIDFFGTLRKVENWTAFSDKPADLTGYYYPVTLKAADGVKLVMTPLGFEGKEKVMVFGETGDGAGTINLIQAVDPAAPVITAYLENADGDRQEMSLDFSKVVCK